MAETEIVQARIQENKLLNLDSFDFHLGKPIGYSSEGRRVNTDKIKVVAPSEKLCFDVFPLNQMTTTAMFKAQSIFSILNRSGASTLQSSGDSEEKEGESWGIEEDIVDAGKTMKMMFTASDVNLKKGIEIFQELALGGCLEVNGSPINELQFREIGNYDIQKIFFQFVGVFIMSSML